MILPFPSVENLVARMAVRGQQQALFETVKDGGARKWTAIRKIYQLELEAFGNEYTAYPVDWCSIMTPIEFQAWSAIRSTGLRFYPQYPVGRRFVDFGDPQTQIAIECDGRDYHDLETDAKRDAELHAEGWQVFHVTGRQCMLPEEDENSVDALVRSLRWTRQ